MATAAPDDERVGAGAGVGDPDAVVAQRLDPLGDAAAHREIGRDGQARGEPHRALHGTPAVGRQGAGPATTARTARRGARTRRRAERSRSVRTGSPDAADEEVARAVVVGVDPAARDLGLERARASTISTP